MKMPFREDEGLYSMAFYLRFNGAANPVNTTVAVKLMDAEKNPDKYYKVTLSTTGEVTINENVQGHLLLQSPNYPENYGDSMNCSVSMKPAKEVCFVKLKIFDFILEDSMHCNLDFLLIENSDGTEPQRLCGQHSGEEIIIKNSGKVWKFQFQTDSSGETRGFNIDTKFILC